MDVSALDVAAARPNSLKCISVQFSPGRTTLTLTLQHLRVPSPSLDSTYLHTPRVVTRPSVRPGLLQRPVPTALDQTLRIPKHVAPIMRRGWDDTTVRVSDNDVPHGDPGQRWAVLLVAGKEKLQSVPLVPVGDTGKLDTPARLGGPAKAAWDRGEVMPPIPIHTMLRELEQFLMVSCPQDREEWSESASRGDVDQSVTRNCNMGE